MDMDELTEAARVRALEASEYGQWEPAADDIAAIAEYVKVMQSWMSPADRRKLLDRAEGVWERYVEGFAKAAED